MSQILLHEPHRKPQTHQRKHGGARTREEVEALLRELAFVLKMTRRVRHQMEAEQNNSEPVLA